MKLINIVVVIGLLAVILATAVPAFAYDPPPEEEWPVSPDEDVPYIEELDGTFTFTYCGRIIYDSPGDPAARLCKTVNFGLRPYEKKAIVYSLTPFWMIYHSGYSWSEKYTWKSSGWLSTASTKMSGTLHYWGEDDYFQALHCSIYGTNGTVSCHHHTWDIVQG